MHRDTTVEELTSYINDSLGITVNDQYQIRKLVKKDRDLSEYSFISFRVTCPANMLNTLLDPKHWPSYSKIREFDLDVERPSSSGARLNARHSETANKLSTSEVQKII